MKTKPCGGQGPPSQSGPCVYWKSCGAYSVCVLVTLRIMQLAQSTILLKSLTPYLGMLSAAKVGGIWDGPREFNVCFLRSLNRFHLSCQTGEIPSHEVWADETTDHKQDPDKRHQNLLQASGEVIERMNGAIWAGAPVIAVPGCSENIFHSSDVAKMTEFFDKSIAGVSINNAADWNITPQGWVYSTLKSQLRLHACGPIDLRDVWVHIHSSRALRFSNKCFTFNKLGANLAGQERLVRFLSPVPDFCNCSIDENGRLDFHYLDYSATEER